MAKKKTKPEEDPNAGRGMEATLAMINAESDAPDEGGGEGEGDGEIEESNTTVDVEVVDPGEPPVPTPDEVPNTPLPADIDAPPMGHVTVPDAAPTRSKARTRPVSPSVKKLGKGLADKVPGAERIKVTKREKDGKKWFIAEYTKDDLSGHGDFESFLTEFVKTEYGPGEYHLMGIDSQNREFEVGIVRLKGSNKTDDAGGMAGLVQTMIAQTNTQNAEYLKRMDTAMQPQAQPNPLELLRGVMDLNDRVNPKESGDAGAAATAAAATAAAAANTQMMEMMSKSGDTTMQMMMMMQQQQQAAAAQQQQMMMAMFSKPKEDDPVMAILLAKLLKDDDGGGGGALPPPPPPAAETPNMVDMITAIGGLMGAMGIGGGGGETPNDDFKEYLIAQQTANVGNNLSMKDILELVTRKDDQPGTDDFRSAVDNMAAIMNISQNMNQRNEGGAAAGIFDALAALFSNRDFAGSIANTIRAKTDQGSKVDAQSLQMAQQRLAHQQRLALQQQQAQAYQRQQAAIAAGQPLPAGQPALVPPAPIAPAPAPFAGAPQGPPVPAAPAPAAVLSDDQGRLAVAAAASKGMPDLPSDTHTHINKIAEAEDDAGRVEATVTMLIYFAEFEGWRVFVEQILGFIRDGDRGRTTQFLTAFFAGFVEITLVEPTLAEAVLKAIDEHFEVVQQQLKDFELEGDREITGDDLLGDDYPQTESGESGGGDVETGGGDVESGGEGVESGGEGVETGGEDAETGGDDGETGGDDGGDGS